MNTVYKLFGFVVIGFLVMAGMRGAEWLIRKPPTQLMICVADTNGKVGHCTNFKDFIAQ